ncbi:MAG: glycosyltransferase family 4 protein [Candidatus Scalinduaceae bacterium]
MLRVAVLGTRGFPKVQGGVEAHCEELYHRLANGSCEVTVFTRKPYVSLKIYKYKGVNLIPLSCPKNKFLEAFLHTFIGIVVIRKFSPDILHIHAIGPSLFIPVARLLGLKVVMTHHGPDYKRKKWGKLAKFVLKLGERLGCKWANCVITISGTVSDHIRKEYERDVTIISNGVTMPEILQSNNSLKEYGLDKGKYLLSVGRFVPEKGFHDLIDSFNQLLTCNSKSQYLNNRFPIQDWKLVIVGDSDHEDKYSLRLKEKAYRTKNVIMTGFLTGEPLHELYSHAGLFVLPSYYEGLPIVLLEAMSYGLSCIASDIPANKDIELLAEDRFFKAGDINGLAKKVNEFVVKPLSEEEKRIQLNGINEKYNWDKIAQKTMKVYESIL